MVDRSDPEQEAVAVIDCGSSAVRAYVANIRRDDSQVLEDASVPVDLVRCLDEGRLDRQAMDSLVEAVVRIEQLCHDYGVQRVRAVGTSALREIANRDVVMERIHSLTGIDLEIIDAAEEARLYCEALREVAHREGMSLRGKTVLSDIGSSSMILSVISGEKLIHSVDEHYGTGRTAQEFAHLHDSPHYLPTVERLALGAARMTLRRLPLSSCRRLLVGGPELRRFAEAMQPDVQAALLPIKLQTIEDWLHENRDLTKHCMTAERYGETVDPLLLGPAVAMVAQLCRELDLDELWVSQLNLRDGILADMCQRQRRMPRGNRALLLAEARSLSSRFGMSRPYASNTASLAVQLFDQTSGLHHLGERDRHLLEFAAWVHDIGAFVNVRNRHKHTLYLIMGSDIAGLTVREKAVVANIARYHRRSPPDEKHPEFTALPRRQRVAVSYLAAILRLAYGLDVDREQRIKQVQCQEHDGQLLLHVDRRLIELERWSIDQKSDMFREVFGLPVRVVSRRDD